MRVPSHATRRDRPPRIPPFFFLSPFSLRPRAPPSAAARHAWPTAVAVAAGAHRPSPSFFLSLFPFSPFSFFSSLPSLLPLFLPRRACPAPPLTPFLPAPARLPRARAPPLSRTRTPAPGCARANAPSRPEPRPDPTPPAAHTSLTRHAAPRAAECPAEPRARARAARCCQAAAPARHGLAARATPLRPASLSAACAHAPGRSNVSSAEPTCALGRAARRPSLRRPKSRPRRPPSCPGPA